MVVLSAGWCRRLGVICGGGLVVRAGLLGERVIGGDDHGVGASVGVERRRSLLAEDPGGAAVSGEVPSGPWVAGAGHGRASVVSRRTPAWWAARWDAGRAGRRTAHH